MNHEQHLKDLQIERLRVRQDHMDVLLAYHTKMMDKTNDPEVYEFHYHHASELNEAIVQLDKLIQTLE